MNTQNEKIKQQLKNGESDIQQSLLLPKDSVNEYDYREYPARYLTLIGFLLIICSYQFTTNVFTPISAYTSEIYDVPPSVVNLNSLILQLLFLPLTIPVSFLMEQIGMRGSIWIAACFIVTAVWLRLLINDNFQIVIVAHVLMGIGFPFAQNMVTKISLVWFRSKRRQVITTVLMMFVIISALGSSLLPGLMMKGYDDKADKQNNYTKGKETILNIMKYQAYIVTGLVIVGSILFQEKPPTPPSFTAEQKREKFFPSIKILLKSRNYKITSILYCLFVGNFLGISTIKSYQLKIFGFKPEISSYTSIVQLVSGGIGGFIGAKMFKSNPRFKRYIVISLIGSITGVSLMSVFLHVGNMYLILIPDFVIGLVSLQAFPIFIELASEIGYPVPEIISSGFLIGGSHLFGFIFGNIYSLMMDYNTKRMVLIITICQVSLLIFCLIVVKFLRIELNRSKEDAKHEKGLKIVEENEEDAVNESTENKTTENIITDHKTTLHIQHNPVSQTSTVSTFQKIKNLN